MSKKGEGYPSENPPSADCRRTLRLSVTKLSGDAIWEDREIAFTKVVADILFELGGTARDHLVFGDQILQLQTQIGDVAGNVNSIAAQLIEVLPDLFVRLKCRVLADEATVLLEDLLVEGRASDPQVQAAKAAARSLDLDEGNCCFTEVHGDGLLGDLHPDTYDISLPEADSKRFPGRLSLEVVSRHQRAAQNLLKEQAIELGTENPTRCMTVGKLAWTELNYFTKADWDDDSDKTVYMGTDGACAPPLWRAHASRWGVNRSELSDGRVVWTGGQYEDSYDPMFCIFNDILVEHPEGRHPELFIYPREVFPPTDYHACVEADGYLYMFGNTGYPEDRTPDRVQVLRLNLTDYVMDILKTDGRSPPWLKGQCAKSSGSVPQDLKLGMTFIDTGRPEVHFKGQPFGILVVKGTCDQIAEIVPDGADAEVCEHNIASLSEQFEVCYEPARKLLCGMRFQFDDDPEDCKVCVLAENGEFLGFLSEGFDHYSLPMKILSEQTHIQSKVACIRENNIVEPPDYVITDDNLADLEFDDLCIAKPPLSTVLGVESDGPFQVACEYQHKTFQCAHVVGRNIAVSLYKDLFDTDFKKCFFNLDTLSWSKQ